MNEANKGPSEFTASVRLEPSGEFIFQAFSGKEYEIAAARTQIIKVLGQEKTLTFIRDLLDRSMRDALILSGLGCVYRKPPTQLEKP